MKNKKSTSIPKRGMSLDKNISDLQNTDYRLGINIKIGSEEGDGLEVNLEPSNYYAVQFPPNYKVIGYKNDIISNRTYYFLTSTTQDTNSLDFKRSSIGYVDNNNIYKINYNNEEETNLNSDCNECGTKAFNPLVTPLESVTQVPSLTYIELINDKCLAVSEGLNFDINFPAKKIEINQEKLGTTLYWNDYRNPPRFINVTDLEEKGAQNYLFEINEPCEDPSYSDCIDVDKLLIFPKHNRITLDPEEQQLGGNLKKGTYEFWAAYCDLMGNEMTQYSTPTNPISIFDENNNLQSQTETDEFTNFAIKIKVNNLDTRHFKYYKIAVVERNNVVNTQSVFLAGIYPTTDDTVIYTHSGSSNDDIYIARGNVSLKKRMDFNTLNAIKPNWEKAKFTMVSGDTLWHGGLIQEEELNIQPVMNLFGGLVHWHTSAASENLYKSAIANSKYKGYTRNEVQPLGIRLLYKTGGYSPTIPFVGRPKISGDDDILTNDTNLESILNNSSPCITSERNQRWQIYNTAYPYSEQCSDIEEGATEIEEPATNSCVVEDVYTIPASSVTIEIPQDGYYGLEDYVENNPEDENISIITSALETVYPGNCEAPFIGDCNLPASLTSETNQISSIENEISTYNPKAEADYLRSVPPAFCSPYKRNLEGTGYQEDTEYMEAYMGCNASNPPDRRARAYVRDANFNNETCGYAENIIVQSDPSQSGTSIFLNYDGAYVESDLLQSGYDVLPSTIAGEFKNKLHTKAQFFRVTKNDRTSLALEITKSTQCPNTADRDNLPVTSKLRYTIYDKCGSGRAVLDGGIIDLNDGFLKLYDVTSYPANFIVAIDSPIIPGTNYLDCDPFPDDPRPVFRVVPPCGCFSMYIREEEFSSVTVSWDNIVIDKVQEYSTICRYRIPKVNDCNPVPYKSGVLAYWESTETYDDNKQLWDSSGVKINGSDLNLLSDRDRNEFLEYYTNGLDSNGTYVLKNADLRCQPIRHPKMPDNTVAPFMIDSLTYRQDADSIIFPLGVELDSNVVKTVINIAYSNGLITKKQRDNIQGYEIMKGDNSVSKSVIANGIAFDFYNYENEGNTINFSNFPFNDLGKNKYLLTNKGGQIIDHPYDSERNHMYSFLSPDLFLTRPALPTEVSLQGFVFGSSMSSFSKVDEHSQWTVLGDKSRRTAEQLAIAEAVMEVLIKTGELIALQQAGFVFSLGAVGAAIAAAGMIAAAYVRIGKYRYDWLTTFRDLGRVDNFANMQTGVARYNKFLKADQYSDEYLRKLAVKKYLKEGDYSVTDENTGQIIKINNWLREQSAFLSTGENYPFDYSSYTNYINYDNNNKSSKGSNFLASEINCKLGVEASRNAASPYFSLKNYIPDQWGKTDSIKWLTTNYIFDIDDNTVCKPIFGGTAVISRFSWRRKAPLFRSNAVGIADKLPFMYSEYGNIAFPRFYCDFEVGDIWTSSGIPFPDIKSETAFDCETGRRDFYYRPPSKFYLFIHGIVDFLVESEINCNFRYGRREQKDNFYPQRQDLSVWLQEANLPMSEPNSFFYNQSYSLGVSNSPYKLLDKTYDKEIWRKRNNQRNAVTYSEKEVNENDLTNPWLVYKPLNWYEFKTNNGKLIDMHAIESDQFLVRFEDRTLVLNSVDNLAERLTPQNINTGTGSMFYQRFIESRTSDLGFNGTQNTDIVSTEYGHITVDAKRGKILLVDQSGQVSSIISEQIGNQPTNMKQWFREQLPFKILKQFPQLDIDNKYKAIGLNMWYDDRESRVFITKKDYIAKNTECLEYDEETGIFYSCGEDTVRCPEGYTYNPISELCERQVISATLCPEGYTYDELTQTCTLVTVTPADCSCTVDVTATPSTQNLLTGQTTSIALTSSTPGATFTWTVNASGVSGGTASSGSTIAQTLTATGGGTGTIIYTVTPSFGNCTPIPIDVIVTVQPVINFDIVSTNWGLLTTASAWESFFLTQLGATFASVTNFSLVSGRVRFSVNTNLTRLDLGTRNITTVNIIGINTLTDLRLQSNNIVTFNPIQALPNGLISLLLTNNQIVTFNPTIPLPSSLTNLNLTNNSIITFNPTIALPSSLQILSLQGNDIVTFNPSIALPSTLKQLILATNNLTTFNPSIALPISLEILALNVNNISIFNPSIALPSGLNTLRLNANNLTIFNPTSSTLSSLQTLELANNDITISAWNTDTAWITAVPNNGTINANNNTSANSISGTNTETMLLAKNWTVIP